ncbi:hypothetical protein CRM22_009545 [Opisthorchis felineus]|uniref:Uncharacterized protein n=1 Tax=Opisthorchis felineus TaxID=147828 RepID=A0A4S2L770_OPIFE|nr:hypothetical protein CRM22_009545 [Opisthorchis felineus]TGZ58610.1 hypothetical protein CRM22_009545 [Opisthorchis felineus]
MEPATVGKDQLALLTVPWRKNNSTLNAVQQLFSRKPSVVHFEDFLRLKKTGRSNESSNYFGLPTLRGTATNFYLLLNDSQKLKPHLPFFAPPCLLHYVQVKL